MGKYARQLAAAARQYESECDCCDHEIADAPESEPVIHADAEREWAGMDRGNAVDESLAEVRRLNRLLGPDWING